MAANEFKADAEGEEDEEEEEQAADDDTGKGKPDAMPPPAVP